MSLDLNAVIKQIGEMVARIKSGRDARLDKISRAVVNLQSQSAAVDALRKKIALSKTTCLVAEPVEKMDTVYALPPAPAEYTALATDGSHIDVDRHHSAHCYLINTSSILLKYGSRPDAVIENEPVVYSADGDLMLTSPDGTREIPVEGNLLGIKRSVEECRKLADLAAGLPPGSVSLAMVDGTLILWNLEGYPDFITEKFLDREYLAYLERMRQLNRDRQLAVVSYISYPRSADVINALRVGLCPKDHVDNDRCAACDSRECFGIAGLYDRELFARVLKSGERSAVFISPSKIQKHYGPHLIYFYYVNLEDEVARVEIPMWVAKNNELLELSHALVVDQCRRGMGYPIALSEAHEKAVVTGTDRDNFWQLVETSMVGEHLFTGESAKSQSKRTRWV